MNKCPWCGRENLNVYAYCQSCGRGFDGPEKKAESSRPSPFTNFKKFWPFGTKAA
jgi:uncharacterized membrane protein YvbJ